MRRYSTLVSLAFLAVASCDRPQSAYEGPFKSNVDAVLPGLEKSTGFAFRSMPKLESRSRDEVRAFLLDQFNEQLTPLEFAGLEATYKRFGLLPDTMDLRQFMLDLLTEQVAGYYDPAVKTLYVVEGGTADFQSVTISHELVHALQDQYFPLDSIRSLKGDNDRQVAFQAVTEGHATYEQLSVALGGDFGFRLPGGWDQVREQIRSAQASMPLFASAPTILQETLLFPYLSGAQFVREFKGKHPNTPPFTPLAASTEQILHPEKLFDSVPDWPTRVTLPAPRGGSLIHEDNLGEFETRLFLFEHIKDAGTAARGARGWDGDRYQLIQAGGSNGLAWLTVWDSSVEAAEFRDLMERSVERRFRIAPNSGGTGTARSWSANGRRFTLTMSEIGGRAVVVWEDLPSSVAAGVIDLRRVTLAEN